MTISAIVQSKTRVISKARKGRAGPSAIRPGSWRRLRPIGFLAFGMAMVTIHGTPALAWGTEGHAVVADIAAAHLTDPARRQVRALLDADGKTSLDQVASWADMVRMQRQDTGPWHYVDIPLEADRYDPARDCPDGQCVVAKIADFAKVLAASSEITRDRIEALAWITHFVGDIHQPLHAEDHNDKGGNEVPVAGFGKRANLHGIWDTDFIERDDPDARNLAKRLDARITPNLAREWSASQPDDWANESHRIAQNVGYGMLPTMPSPRTRPEPEEIDAAYSKAATEAIEFRLMQAGIRLAKVLNDTLR